MVVGIGINDSKEQVLTLEAHCDQEQYLISIALFDDVITARPRDVLPLKLRIKYDKTGTAIDYEILH